MNKQNWELMASSGAAALIVGPLGANPAFLALPPFIGAAWYMVLITSSMKTAT